MIQNKVYIFAGPSGSGKDTLVENLLRSKELNFIKCVSDTTRNKREGEKEGKAYFFVNQSQFKESFKKGNYFQYSKFSGNSYAYKKEEILSKIKKSNIALICHPQSIMLVTFFLEQNEIPFKTIYLDLSQKEAIRRMKERGDTQKDIDIRKGEFPEFEWYKNKADFTLNTTESKDKIYGILKKYLIFKK